MQTARIIEQERFVESRAPLEETIEKLDSAKATGMTDADLGVRLIHLTDD